MRLISLLVVVLALHSVLSEEEDVDANDVSVSSPKINLDSNLRRALLKALNELENEENNKAQSSIDEESKEKIIEKASAASVSIFSNGGSVTVAPVSTSTLPHQVTVLFQQSQSHQQPSITTIEREIEDNESILTSATSNFANQPFGKISQSEKLEKATSQNSIANDGKAVTKLQKIIVTTSAPTVSTDESQAKVEDVQFFSAPLVAAFTVHNDEAGVPKKVEPIFKTHLSTKSQEEIIIEREQQIKIAKQQEQARLIQQQQEKIRLEELRKQQEKLELQQKQNALEEEIYRLKLSLSQQQQIYLKQQEEFRSRNNAQPFIPINNPTFTTERPFFNQQQLPFNNQQQIFKPSSVSLQPSIPFNPLLEAGKLPINGQFLPVKPPVDFRTPFGFNNFNRQPNPNVFNQNTANVANNFNQQNNDFNHLTNSLNKFNQPNQSNRIFRQNIGVGNFGINNDFNRNHFNKNSNSFSIQPAIHLENFDNLAANNRFFRSNLESSLLKPETSFLQPPLPQPVQNTRFFRSNLEGSLSSPSNNVFNPSTNNNYQLSNLLYNSGAFRGKSSEDLSLITKVLSLNHANGNGLSLRPELRQQFGRNF